MKRLLLFLVLLCPILLSGCVLDTILSDVVNKLPTAVISVDPGEGSAPLSVSFNAGYSHDDDGTIAEYRWDFGDPAVGGTGTAASCEHTYTYPGTYLAKLTIIDNEGGIGTQQIAIVVSNSIPVPQAFVSNENPLPGNPVTFDGTASYDLQGDIADYAWDFGDGSTGAGAQIEHTYIEGGYYVATLTVTDGEGATASVHVGMNVQPGESQGGGDSSSCSDGTCGSGVTVYAVITGLPSSCTNPGRVGKPITLDGTYSLGDIRFYSWDFGDGTTASGPVVTHTYDRAWTYTVTLVVTDEYGNRSSCAASCSIGAASCQ